MGCFPGGNGNQLLNGGLTLKLALALSENREYNITSSVNSYLFNNPFMTQEMCINYCNEKEFLYAGLNDGCLLFPISFNILQYLFYF